LSGINVKQYSIFKIGTKKLKYYNWNLNITESEAEMRQELVSLFEATQFRIVANKIIGKPMDEIDFTKVFLQVVVEHLKHFDRATSDEGVIVNGETFKRFVGTTGGLKNNTLLFCNVKYLDRLNELCECKRNKDIPLVPAKYEAYKALTCSASQPICEPNGILVVRDCETNYFADVIELTTSDDVDEPIITNVKNKSLTNNASDGFSLCTLDYMKRVSESLDLKYITNGVCLRNAWFKGMLYAFPIVEFAEQFNGGNYIVKDIWGNEQDLRKVEMITTESSFKLWNAYDSIDDYVNAYRECGYTFSVTKISPYELDDYRELNYQYLQSYDLSDDDIATLCSPTVEYLQSAMGGDYETMVEFLGLTEDADANSWQYALLTSEKMLGDSYIVDCVHRFIKKRIDDAKIGKLLVHGNYQIASGDPFALMQSICGLEVTGLLKAGECYSSYWNREDVDEVVILRSPMTSHNNIRKCKLNHSLECMAWYRYMDNIMIINAWDSFCMAENGCDFDSDILFSTNNDVMVRNYRELPAIDCVQRKTEKVIVTEDEVKKTNINGMGNKVGTITNYVTSMMEVQSRFAKGSDEFNTLQYRIDCGQLFQQDELDKIKGIVAKPMPSHWYSVVACNGIEDQIAQDFNKSICCHKKPYFMIYVYNHVKRSYREFIDRANKKCQLLYGKHREDLTDDVGAEFNEYFDRFIPVGIGDCTMNRICKYVESEMSGCKHDVKSKYKNLFDYRTLKTDARCNKDHIRLLMNLENEYCQCVRSYQSSKVLRDKFETYHNRSAMASRYRKRAELICPDEDERLNIVLDMMYRDKCNKQFCWDCVGALISKRLKELKVKDGEQCTY